MPIFIGEACKVDEDGNPDYDLEPMIGAYAVTVVKYVALFCLHGSVIAICASVYIMTPETAHEGGRFLTDRKQFFEGILIVMCVFLVALLFSSAKVVGMAVKMAIESADQALLGVDITLSKCALNFFKGYVQINKLQVHQPEDEIIYAKNDKGKLVGTPTGKKAEWKYDYIAKVHLVLIKINLWRVLTSLGKEFEIENMSLKGVFLNVEKPNTDLKSKNSNVEYIINFLDALGLIPPPADPASSAKKPEEKKPEAKKTEATKPVEDGKEKASTKIILHKIVFEGFGVGVTIRNVKFLNEISFQPQIGGIGFDDIQRDIFGGREDLSGGEVAACIIKAIAAKIFKQVSQEIPHRLAEAMGFGGGSGGIVGSLAHSVKKGWQRIKGHHEYDEDE